MRTSNIYIYIRVFLCVYTYKNIKIKPTYLPYNAAAVKYFIINTLQHILIFKYIPYSIWPLAICFFILLIMIKADQLITSISQEPHGLVYTSRNSAKFLKKGRPAAVPLPGVNLN